MPSYSPNLFGSSTAMMCWKEIADVIKYAEDDPFVVGMKPDISSISKTRLRKQKRNLLKLMEADKDFQKTNPNLLVQSKYIPEGILIIAYLLMQKGEFMSSNLRWMIQTAIEIEREKLQKRKLSSYNKSQRQKQLNHLQNLLEEYQNGTPVRINLYHSQKGKRRAKQKDKKEREKRRTDIKKERAIRQEDIKFFAEVYMMMRMLYGATKTNNAFRDFAPRIPVSKLLQYMQNDGMADERGRPNKWFKSEMIGRLSDWRAK